MWVSVPQNPQHHLVIMEWPLANHLNTTSGWDSNVAFRGICVSQSDSRHGSLHPDQQNVKAGWLWQIQRLFGLGSIPSLVFDLVLRLSNTFFERWCIRSGRSWFRIAREKLKHLQQFDRSMWRIPSCHSHLEPFAVGGKLAILPIRLTEVVNG